MSDRWRRPYRAGPLTIMSGAFLVFGLGFFALLNDQSGEFLGRRRAFRNAYEQLVHAHRQAT
jgi:hypothetical protein